MGIEQRDVIPGYRYDEIPAVDLWDAGDSFDKDPTERCQSCFQPPLAQLGCYSSFQRW